MAEKNENETRDRRRRLIFLFILADFLVILAVVAFFGWRFLSKQERGKTEENGGGRFEFTAFYHAKDGEWVINDPATHVLKEQKYVSSDLELPQYLVRTLPAGSRVRIVRAMQRWKEVEALDGEKVVCRGWLDAHTVRDVKAYEGVRKE